MLVGFFGCCGAVKESQCLLGSVSRNRTRRLDGVGEMCEIQLALFFFSPQFFACLLIIFGAEVAAGVFGFLNKDKVHR